MDNYENLIRDTSNTCLIWKCSRGFAPDKAADLLDEAQLNWIEELTCTLKIWVDKGVSMTDGELILARANLGSIVESWIRLFLSIYVEDYDNNPYLNNKGKKVPLKKMRFVDLQNYFCDVVYGSDKYKSWLESVRKKRNAIHSFKDTDIGTPADFLDDIEQLYSFVDTIVNRLPPIEDYVEHYPEGYEYVSFWE